MEGVSPVPTAADEDAAGNEDVQEPKKIACESKLRMLLQEVRCALQRCQPETHACLCLTAAHPGLFIAWTGS